uniref:LEM domain-containing protein n=1 Tax=Setaria digitata TaxID=48799 RepID=A0A915PMF7_9BILA
MALASGSKTNVLHLLAASSTPTALDAVQNLLRTGQKHVNEHEDEGLTALHVAAAWDNLAMCQLLLYFGADPFQEDNNGRTAKDMAKGSVKKFFERIYGTKTSRKGRYIPQSFLRALHLLFSCSTIRTVKIPPQPKRRHSWSPSYDGTENFLSEEERRLRWAFRKNQPDPTIPESDDSMTYATAREHNTNDHHELSGNRNPSNTLSSMLSQGIASLKISSAPLQGEDWMTEESSVVSSIKIPEEILIVVRQLSNKRLKEELVKRGESVGPLLESARPAYELKLARLLTNLTADVRKLKYSWALERWIAGHSFSEGPKLDEIITGSFAGLSGEQCRGGSRPASFCYILIDPSIISLPSNKCTMQQFVDSIFYIGKGKRSRPFHHLIDAVRAKDFGDKVLSKSKKLQKIVDLWVGGRGVVSLHIFQNIIPAEAFTREAAMIDAIGLGNLTNVKRGDYYGPAKNWTTREKTIYGSYLLSNALTVFHVEGCREIYEDDLQER